MATTIWNTYLIDNEKPRELIIEDVLSINLKRIANEVWIASKKPDTIDDDTDEHGGVFHPTAKPQTTPEYEDEGVADTDDTEVIISEEEKLEWSRWALKSKEFKIGLKPVFPDLPVIVRPEFPFRLVPGAEAKVFTRIPIWVHIYDSGDNNLRITEIPSIVLSRSWFGVFTEGELGYWLQSTARRKLDKSLFQDHLCVCPISIVNESDEELHVDKLCLRVDRLTIFKDQNSLWSDEMTVVYKGGKLLSDITVNGKAPAESTKAKIVSPPRNPVKKGIAERTFKIFHDLPNIGLKLG